MLFHLCTALQLGSEICGPLVVTSNTLKTNCYVDGQYILTLFAIFDVRSHFVVTAQFLCWFWRRKMYFKVKNTIRDACSPQPREIFLTP